jgi:hypothetical protein
MIYAHVLRSTAPGCAVWCPRDRIGDVEEQILPGLSLLSTNKQIHSEASPMLTKDNVFSTSFFLGFMNNYTTKVPKQYHKAFATFRKFRVYVQTCYFEVNRENGRARINIEQMCSSLALLFNHLHHKQYRDNKPEIEVELVFDGDERLFPEVEMGMPGQTIFTCGQTFGRSYDPELCMTMRYSMFFIWAQIEASLPYCRQVFVEHAPLVSLSIHPDIANFPDGVQLNRVNEKEVNFIDNARGESGVIRLERKHDAWIRWQLY